MTPLHCTADRDSVCAGDDTESHRAAFELPASATVRELVAAAMRACPLASIAGGRATWFVDVGMPARCVAVVAQEWPAPRLLVADGPAAALFGDGARLVYLRYGAQRDPQAAFDALLAGRC